MDCLFCKIIHKEIPATIIYEDENFMAFDDIMPKAPIHKLIIPKVHIATLNDLTPEQVPLLGEWISVAATLAKALKIADNGYRLVSNCNNHGGQTVFHIHFHLLGGRNLHWPPG